MKSCIAFVFALLAVSFGVQLSAIAMPTRNATSGSDDAQSRRVRKLVESSPGLQSGGKCQ